MKATSSRADLLKQMRENNSAPKKAAISAAKASKKVDKVEEAAVVSKDLSLQVYDFLKSRPLIAVKRLTVLCGVDNANFAFKMRTKRPIPAKSLPKMVETLKSYGFCPE